MPGATDLKPGSATFPVPGVDPQIVDAEGDRPERRVRGQPRHRAQLAGADAQSVWGDHDRFFQTYFTTYKGKYFTGDGCRRDEDGYYWITGRVDDVINVSRATAWERRRSRSALVLHPKVAEAAVVGFPHDIKGQGIYAYVTLNAGEVATADGLRTANWYGWVRQGDRPDRRPRRDPVRARPSEDPFSGKIMRRILRKIAEGDVSSLGDTSTLADPAVVDDLVKNRVG